MNQSMSDLMRFSTGNMHGGDILRRFSIRLSPSFLSLRVRFQDLQVKLHHMRGFEVEGLSRTRIHSPQDGRRAIKAGKRNRRTQVCFCYATQCYTYIHYACCEVGKHTLATIAAELLCASMTTLTFVPFPSIVTFVSRVRFQDSCLASSLVFVRYL